MKNDQPTKAKYIKSIKEYYLVEIIGEGASATVYTGVDVKTNQIVAVKSIKNETLKNEKGRENLKREVEILRKMDHENIVKILNYKQTKQNNYIILEYCNGGTLYDYKESVRKKTGKGLNELFIQKILKQLTKGLKYMHSQNIIHRDIKLENILLNFNSIQNIAKKGLILPQKLKYEEVSLNNSFTIKIADLGYSKDLSSDTAATILGTPMYMSPDMINKMNNMEPENKNYNSSIDLWSLGVMTYELLTGTTPFDGNSPDDVFKNISKGIYNLPKNLKPSIEIISFINGLLQYYPEKRLNWAQIMEHPFLNKTVSEFNFIDLETISDNDKKNIELDSKNCDNLLWVFFKCKNSNMKIDKVNEKEIKKPEVQKNIDKNKVINEEVQKALAQEKIALAKEIENANKMKKNALEDKKNAENEKNKLQKEKQQIIENEKKIKEMKDKLLKENEKQEKNSNIVVENEKKLKNLENDLKNLQKEKNGSENKLKNLEIKLNEIQCIIKNSEKEINKLNNEQKDNTINNNKKEELEKLKNENISKAKEIEKLKDEQKKLESEHKKENFALKKDLIEVLNEKKNLEGKMNDISSMNDRIKEKEDEMKNLENKIQQVSEEKQKEIDDKREENEKKRKLIEEINKKNEEENNKGIFRSFIEFNENDVNQEMIKDYEWEEINKSDVDSLSYVDIDTDVIDDYDIVETYVDDETEKNEK